MDQIPQDFSCSASGPQNNGQASEPYIFQQFWTIPGPWIPPNIAHAAYDTTTPTFGTYRSTGVPSECGTAPEDSGYGTQPTYTVSVPSITGNDQCAEPRFPDAEQRMRDMSISSSVVHQQPRGTTHRATTEQLQCKGCGTGCKTRSELKKHSDRHNKPNKCPHKTCHKHQVGFGTRNDLDRHIRTVHGEYNGNDIVFVCRQGTCARKDEKVWPRADNFRNHLARCHKIILKADNDLREYRHRAETTTPQSLQTHGQLAASIHPGRQTTELREASFEYTRRHEQFHQAKEKNWPITDGAQDSYFQSEAAGAHALRGVGSLVSDVDPGSRPAQLQDSPDLQCDQAFTTASGRVQDDTFKQRRLPPALAFPSSRNKPQPPRSNVLDDLKLHSTPHHEPLANPAIVDLIPAEEISLEESEDIISDDQEILESFDQEGDNAIGGEGILNPQDSSTLPNGPPSALDLPEAVTLQDDVPEAPSTTVEPSDAHGLSAEAPTDMVALDSRKPSELFPFLKNIPWNIPGGDGPVDIVSFLRSIPKELVDEAFKAEDQAGSGNDHSSDQAEHQKTEACSECRKTFNRKCELRKHMKRHNKPYGCTYKTCGKTFGSKNDWKRHESSQHFQLESWNCNVNGCTKVLPRRELFKMHLINNHKLRDEWEIDSLQESCRLGRHCDPRFWCGFCVKFVEIEGEVVNSWTKRCDHIDNHLFGKEALPKKSMRQWHYLEDKLAEGEPEGQPAERSSRKRKPTEDMNSRPVKKKNLGWKCCCCSHFESYFISSCQETHCQHQRCNHCQVEETLFNDGDDDEDDDAEMENVNQGAE